MKRRDIGHVLLAGAGAAALLSGKAKAQSACPSPPCYPRTAAEIAASITPVDYTFPEGHVYRYATNTAPGTTDMTSGIQAALDVAGVSRAGRTAFLPAGIYKITSTLDVRSHTQLEGSYGETTLGGGGTLVDSGTKLVWAGTTNSTMLRAFNTRLFRLDGIVLDANSVAGTTCILLDSNNNPSGSQNEFHRFSLRSFAVGVQWGTSGIAGGAYANDGTRFSTFTMWSQVTGSKGFVVNSGNAGQMSTIESGGIQVDDIGLDIRVANILQIRRVFGGWALKTAFIRSSVGIDILIEGCSSEGWGASGSQRASDSKFLWVIAPAETYPMIEAPITMINNQINNPIRVDTTCRIVSLGDAWGYCLDAANHTTSIAAVGTFTAGKSYVLALNNGVNPASINLTTNEPAHGWIDGAYVDLTRLDPGFGWITPAFNAANFSAGGSMIWTVDAGDVETYAYIVANRTMTLAFKINTSSISGTLSSVLRIKIPNGKVATKGVLNTCRIVNATTDIGICYVGASDTYIFIQRNDTSNYVAGTNNVAVQGQITFEVN
jgi:hypothetical protein